MLSKCQMLVIKYKVLSYSYLNLYLKMCTLKETIETFSHSRGYTEVAAGPTLGNGLSGTPPKPITASLTHTYTHKLTGAGQPVPSFLPSFLSWLASAGGLEGVSQEGLSGSLSHL